MHVRHNFESTVSRSPKKQHPQHQNAQLSSAPHLPTPALYLGLSVPALNLVTICPSLSLHAILLASYPKNHPKNALIVSLLLPKNQYGLRSCPSLGIHLNLSWNLNMYSLIPSLSVS